MVPNKAEECLTSLIQPKPPLTAEERISTFGPSDSTLNLVDDSVDGVEVNVKDLDSEGRAVVVDIRLFRAYQCLLSEYWHRNQ